MHYHLKVKLSGTIKHLFTTNQVLFFHLFIATLAFNTFIVQTKYIGNMHSFLANQTADILFGMQELTSHYQVQQK